jgi:hypothetical protein
MTLMNALKHEEGFNEVDPAIRYDNSSFRTRHGNPFSACDSEPHAAKRALMMLGMLCTTAGAKSSLEAFSESLYKSQPHLLSSDWPDNGTDSDASGVRVDDTQKLAGKDAACKGKAKKTAVGGWGTGDLGFLSIFRSARRSLD